MSRSFCAVPLHASAPADEQAQPSAIGPPPQPVLGTHDPLEHIIPAPQLSPLLTLTQAPAAPQVWHTGHPETLQQRPLTQLPVEQSAAPKQASPGLSLHWPPATQ